MTKTDEWFKNRILNRANEYLLDYDCLEFHELNDDFQNFINNIIAKSEIPVLVFFDSYNKWTVLCTQCLYSYYDNVLYYVDRDKFTQSMIPYVDKNGHPMCSGEKKKIHWLKMVTGEFIWLPTSIELLGLLSVLLMLGKLTPKE